MWWSAPTCSACCVRLRSCLTKKACLKTSASAVHFGPGVILGESATRTFSLINEGALDVEYLVTPVRWASLLCVLLRLALRSWQGPSVDV